MEKKNKKNKNRDNTTTQTNPIKAYYREVIEGKYLDWARDIEWRHDRVGKATVVFTNANRRQSQNETTSQTDRNGHSSKAFSNRDSGI